MARLDGMAAICGYVNRSPATVLKLIRESGLPAVKIGGSWESEDEAIDLWRKSIVTGMPIEDIEAIIKSLSSAKKEKNGEKQALTPKKQAKPSQKQQKRIK